MMNKLVYLFLGALSLASCGDAEDVTQPEGIGGETVEVTQEIQVDVLPIQSIVGASTRSGDVKPEKGEALTVTYASDATTRVNKGSVDMTEAESKITNAYIVQFNGTEPTSTAVWISGNIKSQLAAGSPITCSFKMTAGRKNRVYVVANRATALTLGTTLAAFEAPINCNVSQTLPPDGLPMSAMQDVGVNDAYDVFQLRSRLAKFTVTCNIPDAKINLCQVPAGYSYFTQPAGDSPFRTASMSYFDRGGLYSGITYYIPENLSGRNNLLIHHYTRALGMAPTNAMYVEITTGGIMVYNLLLGDGAPQDFNLVAGYAYNMNVALYGTDPYDLRVGNTIPTGTPMTDLNPRGQTANCYIVNQRGWYLFNNSVMGNGAVTPEHSTGISGDPVYPAIIPSKLAPASGEVLWETLNTKTVPVKGAIVEPTIYLLKDRFLFKVGTSEGNAVIAARDAMGEILWSWHIWSLRTPLASLGLKAVSNVTKDNDMLIMDRYLGAVSVLDDGITSVSLSCGLLYQWGRKDPMPWIIATTPGGMPVLPDEEGAYTVEQSIQNPTTFLRGHNDWCRYPIDNLWGTVRTKTMIIGSTNYNVDPGKKSIYDPCPVGWRVPPSYYLANVGSHSLLSYGSKCWVLTDITTSKELFMFMIWGGRNGDSGMATDYYDDISCWTSTPDDGQGSFMTNLGLNGNLPSRARRSQGVNIRCITE